MIGDITCVNVSEEALIAFIERAAVAGCAGIKVSQGDRGWYVTYKSPFTRDVKECETPCSPQEIAEADCDGDIKECGDACHAKH